jgi:Flp pilus assembly protein TadG
MRHSSKLQNLLARLRHFPRDRRGAAALITVLGLPVLFGFAGLSIDVGAWYLHKRLVQTIADSAALAGALEVERSGGVDAVTLAARRAALVNGLSEGKGDKIVVHYPPAGGTHVGASDAVEIEVTRPTQHFFTSLLTDSVFTLRGRAVAVVGESPTCVWALDPSGQAALKISGGAEVNLGCGILVNSNDADALTQDGSSCLRAAGLRVVGGFSGDCLVPTPISGAAPAEDPLQALPPPSHGGCDEHRNLTVNSGDTTTLSPGVYCGKISVVADGNLHLEPGIYVLDRAGLTVSGQATLTGDRVMIYFTDGAKTSDNIDIQGGAKVTLSAPTSGTYAGILFYQDRNSTAKITHSFTGGGTMDLDGTLYFPNQGLKFAGGTNLVRSSTYLVVKTLTFTGNSFVGDFEESAVATNNTLISARLVE